MSEKDARKPDLSDITFYRKKLKALLKPERYEHSLSVSFTCVCLAMRYGVPLHQAEVAGLVHDCAKHFSGKELVERCEKDGIELSIEMLQAPQVIHSVYGSVYAKQAFGITDPDILSAIYYHTLGRPAMTPLEKIVFTADYIEARRYKADRLTELRQMAFIDLDRTVYEINKDTIDYLQIIGAPICKDTLETYDYYKKLTEKKEIGKGGSFHDS
ncbi:MAG: bis(5'-nucleosyl)-tetraphosphatase (symmetrical) YqeK [Oribacterium sp.]|nr:bis(5'-nucleosyl)-tetraphosphatase (symmetrical) YqeK [Oribacterium sp.]